MKSPAIAAPARARGEASASAGRRLDLIGRDVAGAPAGGRRTGLLRAAVLGGFIAALLIAVLRVEILQLRYELAAAVRREQHLAERERELTVRVRRLRDPIRLDRIAGERGFVHPERVIELSPDPTASAGPPEPVP